MAVAVERPLRGGWLALHQFLNKANYLPASAKIPSLVRWLARYRDCSGAPRVTDGPRFTEDLWPAEEGLAAVTFALR